MPQDNRQAILQSLRNKVKPVRDDVVRVGKPPRTTEPVNPVVSDSLPNEYLKQQAADVAARTSEMNQTPAQITTGPNDMAKNAARNAALRKRTAII
jgi:hypothetical protein